MTPEGGDEERPQAEASNMEASTTQGEQRRSIAFYRLTEGVDLRAQKVKVVVRREERLGRRARGGRTTKGEKTRVDKACYSSGPVTTLGMPFPQLKTLDALGEGDGSRRHGHQVFVDNFARFSLRHDVESVRISRNKVAEASDDQSGMRRLRRDGRPHGQVCSNHVQAESHTQAGCIGREPWKEEAHDLREVEAKHSYRSDSVFTQPVDRLYKQLLS